MNEAQEIHRISRARRVWTALAVWWLCISTVLSIVAGVSLLVTGETEQETANGAQWIGYGIGFAVVWFPLHMLWNDYRDMTRRNA